MTDKKITVKKWGIRTEERMIRFGTRTDVVLRFKGHGQHYYREMVLTKDEAEILSAELQGRLAELEWVK